MEEAIVESVSALVEALLKVLEVPQQEADDSVRLANALSSLLEGVKKGFPVRDVVTEVETLTVYLQNKWEARQPSQLPGVDISTLDVLTPTGWVGGDIPHFVEGVPVPPA